MFYKNRVFLFVILLSLFAACWLIACSDGDDDDDDNDDDDDDNNDDDNNDDNDTGDDDTCPDADGDGYTDEECGGEDCDDSNGSIHPGANDICGDFIDQDCDGVADDGCTFWVSETVLEGYVNNENKRYYSLAFLSDGTPIVAYYEATGMNLVVAEYTAGGWVHTNIDTDGDVGMYAFIDVDSTDRIGIAYYYADEKDLRVAFREEGRGWSIEIVDTQYEIGHQSKIRFNNQDEAQVFACTKNAWALNHYWKQLGEWQMEKRFGNTSSDFNECYAIDMDSIGYPGFAWTDWEDYEPYEKDDGYDKMLAGRWHPLYGWEYELIWMGQSIDRDFCAFTWAENDQPTAFFITDDVPIIQFAVPVLGIWNIYQLNDETIGPNGPLSAGHDSDGNIYLGYTDALGGRPRMATRIGPAWYYEHPLDDTQYGSHLYVRVAPDDQPAFIFTDVTTSRLMYAKRFEIPDAEDVDDDDTGDDDTADDDTGDDDTDQ